MPDDTLDAVLEKAVSTPHGQLKASFVVEDLHKVAPLYANPETRAHAEALLKAWAESVDPLRKGMASAWLSRARTAISPAVRAALGNIAGAAGKVKAAAGTAQAAVGSAVEGAQAAVANTPVGRAAGAVKTAATGAYEAGATPAGNLGAAAGAKIANSRLMRGGMEQAQEAGGQMARQRMAQRMAPQGHVEPTIQSESSAAARLSDPGAAGPDSAALDQAYQRGRSAGRQAFTQHTAAHGRTAARWAFKTGLMLGGVGAAAAAGGAIERSQNQAPASREQLSRPGGKV